MLVRAAPALRRTGICTCQNLCRPSAANGPAGWPPRHQVSLARPRCPAAPSPPRTQDFKGKAKWDAWKKNEGKSKEEAQKDYFTLVETLQVIVEVA